MVSDSYGSSRVMTECVPFGSRVYLAPIPPLQLNGLTSSQQETPWRGRSSTMLLQDVLHSSLFAWRVRSVHVELIRQQL